MLRVTLDEAPQAGLGLRMATGAPKVDDALKPLFGCQSRFVSLLRCRGVGLAVLSRTHCLGTRRCRCRQLPKWCGGRRWRGRWHCGSRGRRRYSFRRCRRNLMAFTGAARAERRRRLARLRRCRRVTRARRLARGLRLGRAHRRRGGGQIFGACLPVGTCRLAIVGRCRERPRAGRSLRRGQRHRCGLARRHVRRT